VVKATKVGEAIGLKKGLKQGEAIGLEKGEAIGLEKGLSQGEEIGDRKARLAIAAKLLTTLDLQTVSQMTGLTLDELNRIRSI
jgi:flagellar biosynthesis/type III secretory pathway protein FliH